MNTVLAPPPVDLARRFAPYADLREETKAFADVQDPRFRRKIQYAISPKGRAGLCNIDAPHSFEVTFLESMPSKGPVLHYHNYPEIFIAMQGQYSIVWGNHGEHRVVLEPLDIFSVPPYLMRQVVNTGDCPGISMVLLDDEDPINNIWILQRELDRERAEGKVDPRRKGAIGREMSEFQIARQVAKFADLPENRGVFPGDEAAGDPGAVYYAIKPGAHGGTAAITSHHRFALAYHHTAPGRGSAVRSTDKTTVLIGMRGRYEVKMGPGLAQRVELGVRDTLSIPPGMPHQATAIDGGGSLIMAIFDLVY
ncbi:MAG: hypothetical protein JNM79_20650 [Burkholderiales bacterium]|nr:hypothetical protein [Burkholderiales bacterium]